MTIVFMVLLNPAKLNSFIGPSGRSWGPNWRNSSSWALTIWYLNLCILNSRLSNNKLWKDYAITNFLFNISIAQISCNKYADFQISDELLLKSLFFISYPPIFCVQDECLCLNPLLVYQQTWWELLQLFHLLECAR